MTVGWSLMAAYATGRCPNSSHSTFPGAAGFVDTLRAVWDTGDAAAPLDPRLPRAAREAALAALRPSRVVGSDGGITRLAGGLPVEEGDALVVATSGSPGSPKGSC